MDTYHSGMQAVYRYIRLRGKYTAAKNLSLEVWEEGSGGGKGDGFEELMTLGAILGRLPQIERKTLLVWGYFNQLGEDQICRKYRWGKKMFRSRRSRAIRNLEKELERRDLLRVEDYDVE